MLKLTPSQTTMTTLDIWQFASPYHFIFPCYVACPTGGQVHASVLADSGNAILTSTIHSTIYALKNYYGILSMTLCVWLMQD